MSEGQGASDPNSLQQIAGAIGFGAAVVGGFLWNLFKGAKEGKEERRQIVLDELELSDMRPVREIVPLVRKCIELVTELHAKRDRADANVAAMHTEFRDMLRDIEYRLQKMEVELTVLNRLNGRG